MATIFLAAPRLLATPPALTDHPVGDDASLRAAILAAGDGDTITFTSDITLAGDLPAVQSNVTILGQGHTLSGNDAYRGLFIGKWTAGTATQVAVTVTIQDLTITHALAQGGNGGANGSGGGGAGLGGAIFVADLANLTVANVSLISGAAAGGAAVVRPVGSGGGGMGGDGGPGGGGGTSGGGGIGRGAGGGGAFSGGNPGILTGARGGGAGAGSLPGGVSGGSGAGGGGGSGAAGGGGVGGGSGVGTGVSSVGGQGGFGGGGGTGGNAGAGGFGGGGGGGNLGGNGGFGGGGGGGAFGGGVGGFGGGDGVGSGGVGAGGGGGLGAGGAIFVQQGGTLILTGSLTINGNTVAAGSGGAGNAAALGSGIFLQGSDVDHAGTGSVTFSPAVSQTQSVTDVIADQTGSGGSGGEAGDWSLTKSGAGTLILGGANTYSGATTVAAGTLRVTGSTSASSAVTVASGATLGGTGTIGGPVTITGGTLAPGNSPGRLTVGSLALNSSSTMSIEVNGTTAGTTYDQVRTAGTVALGGATLSLDVSGFTLVSGQTFTIVDKTAPGAITGTFNNLAQGATFAAGGRTLRITYTGGDGNDVVLTVLGIPTLSSAASAGITFGGSIHDTTSIVGAVSPTGTIAFRLYGPGDATCAGAPVFTDSKAVTGAGPYDSAAHTPAAVGVYRWIASYSGDANNLPSASACSEANQSVTVSKANQTITFVAPADRAVDSGPFSVTATASSGLTVTLIPQTPAVCTISSGMVTLVSVGTCTITADQGGNGNFNAAPQVTRSFNVTANCGIVSVSPATLPLAVAALPYATSFSVTNGASPVAWTVGGTLPTGVTFANGVLSGAPQTRGAFPLTIAGTDAHGCQASVSVSLLVSAERRVVAGAGGFGLSTVRAFNLADATMRDELTPFAGFVGGASVAHADTNGDGVADAIAGSGPGGAPGVAIVDGVSRTTRLNFSAFDSSFRGGVEVAAGDITGDGRPEILVVAGGCAAPSVVRAFNSLTGALVREYPFTPPNATCGYHLGAGDITGDGLVDLVVGAGETGASFAIVLDGYTGAIVRSFYPYTTGFGGGAYVAAGDVTGDGIADIITGPGPGGGPHVRVFDGVTNTEVRGLMAYDTRFAGGVRVAAGDLNGDGRAEIITAAGPGGGPHLRAFDGRTGVELLGLFAFDPSYAGGVFVAAPTPLSRVGIDIASANAGQVRVAGWALREGGTDSGTDAVHVWAYPVGGAPPVFVGAAASRGTRPDVASTFGGEFLMSGFDITGPLAPGTYDVAVCVRNSRTLLFDQFRVVRITVN